MGWNVLWQLLAGDSKENCKLEITQHQQIAELNTP
jgi:hypothetical protein